MSLGDTMTRTLRRPLDGLDDLGGQLQFYARALVWTPRALRRYTREVVRLLAEVSLGTGALSVIGGTVGVIAFLAFFTG
jgi:phospholipid/cholesterol/gamma-HCH transport system permease protein